MKQILEILNNYVDDYVIVGSLALYLHGEIDEWSGKDIDIIVDKDIDAFDHLEDFKLQQSRFSSKKGWVVNIAHTWVEIFNKPLPEYDEFEIDGITVKVKTLSSIKEFYRNMDLKSIGGHTKFQNKLMTYMEMSK